MRSLTGLSLLKLLLGLFSRLVSYFPFESIFYFNNLTIVADVCLNLVYNSSIFAYNLRISYLNPLSFLFL